jgi:tetratricopeptide (TPR) repeat protein
MMRYSTASARDLIDGDGAAAIALQLEAAMTYDFNILEQRAQELLKAGRPKDAIHIYLFMADGDPSLDGGYLGKRLGECYERMEDLHAAKYWYGRAVEENPAARRDCAAARQRLAGVTIDDLVSPRSYAIE